MDSQTAARCTFDRSADDVAKLVGCNTRNVEYRWDIFETFLARIPRGAEVLDFGAGSLRESFDLARRGFRVTALDLNAQTLEAYRQGYDWSTVAHAPQILAGTLDAVAGRQFALITAFDVFEHLEDPKAMLARMHGLLADDGVIVLTVPNRRTLFEIVYRVHWKIGVARGVKFTPGEPHIQFKSPREWAAFFNAGTGFRVLAHRMAIGFFVNTWSGVVQIPSRILRKLLRRKTLGDTLLDGKRMMAAMNFLDAKTQPALDGLAAWNLMVLGKAPKS